METPMTGVITAWYKALSKGPTECVQEENILMHLVSKDIFPDTILVPDIQ